VNDGQLAAQTYLTVAAKASELLGEFVKKGDVWFILLNRPV